MSQRPIVTLTTDFGMADWYAGALRGAVLRACPDATIVDITHDIPPHDIEAGAFALLAASPGFPPGTVHLAVVDPGVGGARRPLAVHVGDGVFVGPDNGLLGPAIEDRVEQGRVPQAVVIDAASVATRPVSATFHGRDIFAPAAGRLARGDSLRGLGEATTEWVHLPGWRAAVDTSGCVLARVIYVDRFGNAVTNLRAREADLHRLVWRASSGRIIRYNSTYSSVECGQALLITGSTGFIEVAAREASACELLGLTRGSVVRFENLRQRET